MTCNRCGAPMDEEIGLGYDGQLEGVRRCRCGSVELLQVPWTRAEVQRRIATVRGRR